MNSARKKRIYLFKNYSCFNYQLYKRILRILMTLRFFLIFLNSRKSNKKSPDFSGKYLVNL